MGEIVFNPLGGLKEIEGVCVVLLDACGDGEDIGIKDNVLGRKADFVDEAAVGAFADFNFVFVGGCLTVFVEGHDHGGGAELHDRPGVFLEGFFSFFERD